MKPTLLLKTNAAKTPSRNFPAVASHYQLVTLPKFGSGNCACPKLPAFRQISGDYFRNEARGEFRRELIAFAAIVVTAAVPMISNAHALSDFLRAIGRL